MAGNAIHFGTSGWRGIIAEDFTFERVRIAATAIARHIRSHSKSPTLLIGYDTRFFSEEFALAAASTLETEGCLVSLCRKPTPTPAIAHYIRRRQLAGGVNITASHNPAEYNGMKFSGPDGGPTLPEITRDIEARAARLADLPHAAEGNGSHHFEHVDLQESYFEQLAQLVRFNVIRDAKLPLVFDALHGCGAGWLDGILKSHGIEVHSIRAKRDVLFDGSGPDPSEENLAPLRLTILETHSAAGLATDGDADRFGILDRDGSFISPNHILALLFDYVVETRGWRFGVARSVATTHFLDAVARHHGVSAFETPVGFKYFAKFLQEDMIALAGEESAGLTIRGHVPEKDGILACLLVAEMIAARKTPIGEQLGTLFRRVGREFWPIRINFRMPEDKLAGVLDRLRRDFSGFAGHRVARINRTDGVQLILDDDSWLLMRPSGTEPLVRIYAESNSVSASQKIAEEALTWISA